MQNYVIFVKKDSYKSSRKIKIIGKLEIIATIQVNIEAQHIVNVPNEIPVVFLNGSKYDYHFIIK